MLWETAPVKRIRRLAGEDFQNHLDPRVEQLLLEGYVLWGIYQANDHRSNAFYDVAVEIIKLRDSETVSSALVRHTNFLTEADEPPYYTVRWVAFKVVYSHQPWWRRIWSNLW